MKASQKIKMILFTLGILVVANACRKDATAEIAAIPAEENNKTIEGIYAGVFKVVYPDTTMFGPVTVVFENGDYTCSNGSFYVPAGGNGSFEADDSLHFSDGNFYQASFDWSLILRGDYGYELTDTSLLIQAHRNGPCYYEYKLTKQ